MPTHQLHKRFTTDQVKAILAKYVSGEMKAKEAMDYLELKKSQFYEVIFRYKENRQDFSLEYSRSIPTRRIDISVEKNILKELQYEKEKIIDSPDVPTDRYNYSYIKRLLKKKYHQEVALSTIIERAKRKGYWKKKPPKKVHDREVITNYAGELIQHDSSHHLFAPDAKEKWYLITSLDDYSRKFLYADFWETETSWKHILALQSVVLQYGIPLSYYTDQHRTFRYVKERDKYSTWVTYSKFTDDCDPQWKQVVKDCGIKPIYALSPQAKGKIERPYRWLQDNIVRTCVREGIATIYDAKEVLKQEVRQYNTKRIHSTTQEVPIMRFNNALKEQRSLFREFKVEEPFQSVKDIFCLRITRTVDAYRNISLKKFRMSVPGVPPRHDVELRLIPDLKRSVTEVRFWYGGRCTGVQRVKNEDIPVVRF